METRRLGALVRRAPLFIEQDMKRQDAASTKRTRRRPRGLRRVDRLVFAAGIAAFNC